MYFWPLLADDRLLSNIYQIAHFFDFCAWSFIPDGLTKLANGFNVSLNNQHIFQKQTMKTGALRNNQDFTGKAEVPLSPFVFCCP